MVEVTEDYDVSKQMYRLTLKQHTPSTPGQPQESKLPLMIPVVTGLLSQSGAEIAASRVLLLTESQQTFEFPGVTERPIPSILRDFSAPVRLKFQQSNDDLSVIMAHDTDSYNRWEAANRLSTQVILGLAELEFKDIYAQTLPPYYLSAVKRVLQSRKDASIDRSLIAYALQLPDLMTLSQEVEVVDPDRLNRARNHVQRTIAQQLYEEIKSIYDETASSSKEYVFSPQEVSRRRLRNTCLDYLTNLEDKASVTLAYNQFLYANCMSDQISAMYSLVSGPDSDERSAAIMKFYEDAGGDALVLNKWFSIQAAADRPGLLDDVIRLKSHPDFTMTNPNRARSLLSVFAGNMPHFHSADGKGYTFIADCVIELDKLNPQVAARMAGSFSQWRRFDGARQNLMRAELERIRGTIGLSKDTFEVVTRTLK